MEPNTIGKGNLMNTTDRVRKVLKICLYSSPIAILWVVFISPLLSFASYSEGYIVALAVTAAGFLLPLMFTIVLATLTMKLSGSEERGYIQQLALFGFLVSFILTLLLIQQARNTFPNFSDTQYINGGCYLIPPGPDCPGYAPLPLNK